LLIKRFGFFILAEADSIIVSRLGDWCVSEPRNEAGQRLSAARAGSQDALGQALEACRGYLLQIAQEELGGQLQAKGGASDLVQETLLDAVRAFGQFRGQTETELLQWLRRLLLNNLADFARLYRQTGKRQIDREVHLETGDSSAERDGGLGAALPSPSGHAINREQEQALQRALAELPEDYRQVVLLRYREERSFEEIGHIMGRSANAIRKLWLRAVQRLKEGLKGLT
jgi:RNA polymerase sigma-70 factor (ECF subfamily)